MRGPRERGHATHAIYVTHATYMTYVTYMTHTPARSPVYTHLPLD
jgi:hypothetical protein